MVLESKPFPDCRHLVPGTIHSLWLLVGKLTYPRFYEKVAGITQCSAEIAVDIEKASGRKIHRGDLRPDLWPRRQSK